MKNIFKKLLVLTFFSLAIFSCNNDLSDEKSIEENLITLKSKINSNYLKKIKLTENISNLKYFAEINEIKKIKDKNLIEKNLSNSANKNNEIELNPISEIILKDFFNTLSINNEVNFKAITQLYINEIKNLSNDEIVIKECTENLILVRDYMIYLKFGIVDNNSQNKVWACAHRDCFDCCMYKKAYAVFVEGNWVDQASFLSSAAGQTAWWAGSCAWDCY